MAAGGAFLVALIQLEVFVFVAIIPWITASVQGVFRSLICTEGVRRCSSATARGMHYTTMLILQLCTTRDTSSRNPQNLFGQPDSEAHTVTYCGSSDRLPLVWGILTRSTTTRTPSHSVTDSPSW